MTKTDAITLIEASESLRQNNEEKEYWLAVVEDMNEAGLDRLSEILKEEANARTVILENLESTLERIDGKRLEELTLFNRTELPKFVKKWEVASRDKENPEEVLNQAQL